MLATDHVSLVVPCVQESLGALEATVPVGTQASRLASTGAEAVMRAGRTVKEAVREYSETARMICDAEEEHGPCEEEATHEDEDELQAGMELGRNGRMEEWLQATGANSLDEGNERKLAGEREGDEEQSCMVVALVLE